MMSKTRLLLGAVAAAAIFPSMAMAWTKSYVVEWFEPAFYFGAPKGASEEHPGSDCPTGPNDLDIPKELEQPWRPKERVAYYMNPENGIGPIIGNFGFRGPNAENIYENPTSRADPGFKEVIGKIAEGLNLDGDEKTGFTGVTGEKGVDNNYYRTAGCVQRWRGVERNSHTGKYHMELMRSGGFTVLIVVNGRGADPMNDEDVTVGFYVSQDKLVKDANGEIAPDYSFRVSHDQNFQTVFAAHTRNGVLEEDAQVPLLRTHETRQTNSDNPFMRLHKARIRFDLKQGDQITGLVAGYRTWYDLFRDPMGNGGNSSGAIAERLSRFNAIGFYYALRRNADGLPDAEGRNTGISAAYRYYLRPAFVVTPDTGDEVKVARIFDK